MEQDTKSSSDRVLQRFAREYPAGAVVFREGDDGEFMYVIRTGRVRITKRLRGRDTTLGVLNPGDFFGEMAILGNRPRSATATVEEAANLIVIGAAAFEAMLRANTEIALRMISKLSERLATADRRLQTLLLGDPDSRVAAYFLQRLDEEGFSQGLIAVTPEQIVEETGCELERVREALEVLRDLGLVTRHPRGGFEVHGRDALAGHLELLA